MSQTSSGAGDDEERGYFAPDYPLDMVEETLAEIQPAQTTEVQEALGCAYRTALQKLTALEEEGRAERPDELMVGPTYLWIISDDDE